MKEPVVEEQKWKEKIKNKPREKSNNHAILLKKKKKKAAAARRGHTA